MSPRFPAETGEAINGGGEEDEEENRERKKKKKQGASVREWLTLDEYGNQQLMEVGKHAIMRRTGLPARDLRALDPLLSYPSSILGREKAIVMNLEHIKAIITAHEVLLLNPRDPSVDPFAAHLQGRITQLPYTPVKQVRGFLILFFQVEIDACFFRSHTENDGLMFDVDV